MGIDRKASPSDIKSAYRRLAKKLHPDANKNDPKAATRFSELNAAHELLGDEDKRKAFDRGEIDAEGKPRFRGFEGAHPGGGFAGFESFTWGPEGVRRSGTPGGAGLGGFEDILSNIFGQRGRGARANFGEPFEDFAPRSRGQDISAQITITLAEAARGGSRRVHLANGKEVEFKIPLGLTDGQQIRLKGQGYPAPGGGPAGDALITVSVAPHPYLKPEGVNLRVELPITLYEAVLGAKVRVPTLEGAVELAIPAGTSAGRTFRLRGKGLPTASGHGDLYASVRIVLPEEKDSELEELMRKRREQRPYHPRKGME